MREHCSTAMDGMVAYTKGALAQVFLSLGEPPSGLRRLGGEQLGGFPGSCTARVWQAMEAWLWPLGLRGSGALPQAIGSQAGVGPGIHRETTQGQDSLE